MNLITQIGKKFMEETGDKWDPNEGPIIAQYKDGFVLLKAEDGVICMNVVIDEAVDLRDKSLIDALNDKF